MANLVVLGIGMGAILGGILGYAVQRGRPKPTRAAGSSVVHGALLGALLGAIGAQVFPVLSGRGYAPDVRQITSREQFRTIVLESDVPVLVDFYKNGCPPCATLSPTLEALSAEYAGKAKIVKVDVGARPGLAREYGIRYTPTVVLFHSGQPSRWVVGAKDQQHYRDLLATAGDSNAPVAAQPS